MARQWDKPMLVFFFAPWCPFSRQMLSETFHDPQVVRMAKQFICIQVDVEQNPELCQTFQVRSLPTVQLLSSRAIPLTRLIGHVPAKDLVGQMQGALQSVASRRPIPPRTPLR